MRVFVTGASGLIGTQLCQDLVDSGHSVVALTRTPRQGTNGHEWVTGTAQTLSDWEKYVCGCDAVVNLAGATVGQPWTRKRMEEIVRSRVGLTTALYHALAHAKVRPPVLVNASAIGYYGPCGDELLDETTPRGDGFLARVCEEWERAAIRAAELDVRVAVLRIGMVLAPNGGALAALSRPLRAFVGGALGHGNQWISWIHVRDVSAVARWCLSTDQCRGVLNAVAPNPVRQRELVTEIGRVLGRPVWLDAPASFLRLGLGAMAKELLLAGQKVDSHKVEQLGFGYEFPELTGAVEDCLRATRR